MTADRTTPSLPRRLGSFARSAPFSIFLGVAILVVGVLSRGLWEPAEQAPWFSNVAWGLPSAAEGRWWTPISGLVYLSAPRSAVAAALGLAAIGWLETRRGTMQAALWFLGGHLFAVLGALALVSTSAWLPWPWLRQMSFELETGIFAGGLTCLGVALAGLRAPWRRRLWLLLVLATAVALLYVGRLRDLEDALAVALALTVFLIRTQRAKSNSRETRICVALTFAALVAIDVVTTLVTTTGPFGHSDATPAWWWVSALQAALCALVARSLVQGRRWAWWIAVLCALFNVVVPLALATLVLGMTTAATPERPEIQAAWVGSAAGAVLWVSFLAWLIVRRSAFATTAPSNMDQGRAVNAAQVREHIHGGGGGTFAWMGTWDGFDHHVSGDSMISYQRHRGVAIALGDPVGPRAQIGVAAADFIDTAEAHRLVPCFFSASRELKDTLPATWRALPIATDAVIDLETFTLKGSSRSKLRQALSRGKRDGEQFQISAWSELPFNVRQQIESISATWLETKELPEMRFTLGTLAEAHDGEVRIAVALSAEGKVDGFLSWLPSFASDGSTSGWTLDLMRRTDGGFSQVMEFLIVSSILSFAEHGAQWVSLSGAPLTAESDKQKFLGPAMETLSQILEPVYGFRSLLRFKKKFSPDLLPLYLLYRDEGDLPRIGAALTRAFLPDASPRELARFAGTLVNDAARNPHVETS